VCQHAPGADKLKATTAAAACCCCSYDFTQEMNAEEQDIIYDVDDHANTSVNQIVAGSDAIANADEAEQ
jgi:hypothetical protein